MPDELEAIQADVGVDFTLPNGKTLLGKPVFYDDARKIMALLHQFDRSGDYEATVEPAMARFGELTGITSDQIKALCPSMTLGDQILAIQRFFFRLSPQANGKRLSAAAPGAAASGA